MKRKLPLMLSILCSVTLLFSQEKVEKTSWYTSTDTKGYISIQKVDSIFGDKVYTVLNTTVKATFNDEVLDFSLSTINDTDKMVSPSKFIFDGTIDSNIKPVKFTGTLIKKDKKEAAYWSFDGDFTDEIETDPDFKRFAHAKHSATLKIPERTIPSFNLWAIVPNLKFDRRGTFKFNSLDETKLYVKRNQTVNYLGKTKADINGKSMVLHKFVQQSNGKNPTYYWVNEDRELVQILLDNQFTFTLNSKEAAITTLANNNE